MSETAIEKVTINSFDKIKERFIQLTDEETFFKEASFAMQHIQKNPSIMKCDYASIQMAVLNVSQIGITLNPALKLAYLVPRKGQCCLDISYMGLSKIVTDTGSAVNIYAHTVYENDLFEQTLGTSPEVIHKPKLADRGKLIAVYCVSVLHNGSKQVEVMDYKEVISIRDDSDSYKSYKSKKDKGEWASCIWVDHESEMFRKTVIKRAVKYLPKTEQYHKLAKAIEVLDEDWAISYDQAQYIESLLHQSYIPEERKEWICKTLNTMKKAEAGKLIEELKEKQINPMQSLGYKPGQISEEIGKIK